MKSLDHPLLSGIENVEPYNLNTSRELYGIDPPPMLIEDFLPQGGIMGITAMPGVGKSWLTLEVLRAVGIGDKFLGKFPAREGACLFVGSDSSIFDYARQWTRLVKSVENKYLKETHDLNEEEERALMEPIYGPDWRNGPLHSVRFLLQSPFMFENMDEIRRVVKTHFNFMWGPYETAYDDVGEVDGIVRRTGFNVIVFDTLSRLTRANQNDNTDMEEVFRNIRMISEVTGAAIILLHHNSKKTEFNDGADWRGALSQIGALDSWVQLSPSKRDKYLIGVEYKKFRGIQPADFAYRMEVNDPVSASLIFSDDEPDASSMQDKTGEAIYVFLKGHAGTKFTVSQISDAIMPVVTDFYAGNKRKLVTAVRNRAEWMYQHPQPNEAKLYKSGGGKQNNRAYYWVRQEDVVDDPTTQSGTGIGATDSAVQDDTNGVLPDAALIAKSRRRRKGKK